ncbi:hypothetical protein [Mycoplasma nasistruthionis]|uniref:hypothetical protein n=1 Tax=Mycoplasma nasistruthionis TaxID=353852 RepID=UPI001FEA9655|nr:hypothetical protein [Mycoplasma nasistruthionis]
MKLLVSSSSIVWAFLTLVLGDLMICDKSKGSSIKGCEIGDLASAINSLRLIWFASSSVIESITFNKPNWISSNENSDLATAVKIS